jgi:hypothetical protein
MLVQPPRQPPTPVADPAAGDGAEPKASAGAPAPAGGKARAVISTSTSTRGDAYQQYLAHALRHTEKFSTLHAMVERRMGMLVDAKLTSVPSQQKLNTLLLLDAGEESSGGRRGVCAHIVDPLVDRGQWAQLLQLADEGILRHVGR